MIWIRSERDAKLKKEMCRHWRADDQYNLSPNLLFFTVVSLLLLKTQHGSSNNAAFNVFFKSHNRIARVTRLEYNRVGWLASHCWSFVIGITFDSVFCGCDGVIDRQTTVYKSIFAIITTPRAAKMQSEPTDKCVAGSEASVERESCWCYWRASADFYCCQEILDLNCPACLVGCVGFCLSAWRLFFGFPPFLTISLRACCEYFLSTSQIKMGERFLSYDAQKWIIHDRFRPKIFS